MTYYPKKDKTLIIWFIFFIIISFFISLIAILEYISITSAIISLIFASLPFILVAIFKSNDEKIFKANDENKYQIIMSIVYYKYIEDNDAFLHSVINSSYEYASQIKQAYDELFEKITPEEWQQACEKFYKLKEKFEKANKEQGKKMEQENTFIENEKWLFKHHLKKKD